MRFKDYEAVESPMRARFASPIAIRRARSRGRRAERAVRAAADQSAASAASDGDLGRRVLRREAAPEGVLGDGPGEEELVEVVGAAGLGPADPRELEAAEGLAVNQGPGDRAVDVDVADAERPLDPLDVRRAPRVEAAGQGVGGRVGDRPGRRRGRGPGSRRGSGRRFPPGRPGRPGRRRRRSGGRRSGPIGEGAGVAVEDDPALGPGDRGVVSIRVAGVGVDHGADDGLGVLGRADGERARRPRPAGRRRRRRPRPGRPPASRPSTSGRSSRRRDWRTPTTASSRSASSSTMMAFLPPISAITRLTWSWPSRGLGRPAVDLQADGLRAGEGDQVDPGVVHQGLADDLALAGEVVEDARREPGLAEGLVQLVGDHRRLLGRLEDHRVARPRGRRRSSPSGSPAGSSRGG